MMSKTFQSKYLFFFLSLYISLLVAEIAGETPEDFDMGYPYYKKRSFQITVFAFKNGGNNTVEDSTPVEISINTVQDDLNYFKLRAGVKLNYIPEDCTEWTRTRPRRPWSYLNMAPSPEREPDPRCGYQSWVNGIRVFDVLGRRLDNLYHLKQGDILYIVPPGDHFFWHGGYVGRSIYPPGVTATDGSPIEMITVSLVPRLFHIPHLLSKEEAEWIIEKTKPKMVKSMGFDNGQNVVVKERTSEQTWLACNAENKIVCDVEERIAALLRIPYEHVDRHSDTMQILHYPIGTFYHSHTDWFDPTMAPKSAGLKEGYNRMITLFIYLNDVDEGGETIFPMAGEPELNPGSDPALNPWRLGEPVDFSDCVRGFKAKPRTGSAVLWYNMKAAGNGHEGFTDQYSLHGGCPPLSNSKWGMNKWVYNHNWAKRALTETWRHGLFHPTEQTVLSEAPDAPILTRDGVYKREVKTPDNKDIDFKNLRKEKVTVYWVPPGGGKRVEMSVMNPGDTQRMQSFIGHKFEAYTTEGDLYVAGITVEHNTPVFAIA